MSEGNGRSDKLNFGKYKGQTIGALLKGDPYYLCWLRDEIAKDKRQSFFDQDVNDALDQVIEIGGKKKAGKYTHWGKTPPDFTGIAVAAQERVQRAAVETEVVHAVEGSVAAFAGYGNEWGAF